MQYNRYGPKVTEGVKLLIIINSAVFAVQVILKLALALNESPVQSQFEQFFALNPRDGVLHGYIWQLFTYQFLHYTGSLLPFHLLFNMMGLWMFGSELEEKWGKQKFIEFYLICGVGAGFFIFIIPIMFNQPGSYTLGASGALFGLLLAYAIYWPDRKLLFMFMIPIKVKYFVLIFGLISLGATFANSGGGSISHVGHLGGLITAYLYLLYDVNRSPRGPFALSSSPSWNLVARFKQYKKRREWMAKQKEVLEMANVEEKVDILLEKISKSGIKSLSSEEKKFLKKASQNLDEADEIKFH